MSRRSLVEECDDFLFNLVIHIAGSRGFAFEMFENRVDSVEQLLGEENQLHKAQEWREEERCADKQGLGAVLPI